MATKQIDYSFLSDSEPTDEQLHLLMKEVMTQVKAKAEKTNHLFWDQLHSLVNTTKKNQQLFNTK